MRTEKMLGFDDYSEELEAQELKQVEQEEQEAKQELETEQAETGINYKLVDEWGFCEGEGCYDYQLDAK